MCIDNIGACDARNLEESCGQGGAGGPENGESFALLALVGGLDFALHLHTRALTPRKHALVDGHEGPKRCMASGWNSG